MGVELLELVVVEGKVGRGAVGCCTVEKKRDGFVMLDPPKKKENKKREKLENRLGIRGGKEGMKRRRGEIHHLN